MNPNMHTNFQRNVYNTFSVVTYMMMFKRVNKQRYCESIKNVSLRSFQKIYILCINPKMHTNFQRNA